MRSSCSRTFERTMHRPCLSRFHGRTACVSSSKASCSAGSYRDIPGPGARNRATARKADAAMKRGGRAAFTMIALAFLALLLLVAGWGGLEARLPGGLPIGNRLSARSRMLAAGAAVVLSDRGTWVRRYAVAALILATAWLPLSIALAGNADLNFNARTASAWFTLTAITLALS